MTPFEDLRLIVDTVAAFADGEVAPAVGSVEATGELTALMPSLRQQGLLDLAVPETRGGSGLDLATFLAVLEELARRSAATADLVAAVHVAELAVATLADGPPPALRVLVDAPGVELDRNGDGWSLRGTAPRVHHAALAERFLVLASDQAVDVDARVVAVGPTQQRSGLRGSDPRRVDLTGVSGEDTLAAEVAGVASRLRWLTAAAISLGIARQALDEAAAYVRGRRQFGTVLADLPALRAMLADMQARVEGAAAHLAVATERDDRTGAGLAAAGAVSAACSVTVDAIQLHGGYGYITEYPVERLLRDAVSLRASLGGTRPLRQPAGRRLAEVDR